jgi:hypothetical protein
VILFLLIARAARVALGFEEQAKFDGTIPGAGTFY